MELKLYHGSKENHRFKGEFLGTFLTTDLKFTNNAEYGGVDGVKYEVTVDLKNCFDSTNCEHIKVLYNAGLKLSDPYLHIEDPVFSDFDDDFGGFDDDLFEGELVEEGLSHDYYKTPQAFCKSKTIKSSTWEAIEESEGVLEWIRANYDSTLIIEAGVKNFIVFKKECIKVVKRIQ